MRAPERRQEIDVEKPQKLLRGRFFVQGHEQRKGHGWDVHADGGAMELARDAEIVTGWACVAGALLAGAPRGGAGAHAVSLAGSVYVCLCVFSAVAQATGFRIKALAMPWV